MDPLKDQQRYQPPPYYDNSAAACADDEVPPPYEPIKQDVPTDVPPPYYVAPYPGNITTQPQPYTAQPYGQQFTYIYQQPAMPLTDPPNDYMGYSIFVTLCCCWILGILAIAKSSECRAAIANGDYALAQIKSREARGKANLALCLGIFACVITGAVVGVYVALRMGSL